MRVLALILLAGCASQSYAIKSHRADVEMCYSMGLQRRADLAGQVVVELEVGAGGHVQTARIVSSTLADGEVEACIAEAAARWDFPGRAPGRLTVPFVLGGE